MKVPCQHCEARTVGCHSICKDYQEYRQYREQRNLDRHMEQEANGYMADAIRENKKRVNRRRRT